MLKRATVLVLGAGASQPFGFPTGVQLSKLMAEHLHPGTDAFNRLMSVGYEQDGVINFRDEFFYSGKISVDSFLEHRADLLSIGKAATAAILIPFERPERVFSYENSWLRYLYNNLNASFEQFADNPLSIVTFNYDRTVEFFLFEALCNSYRKDEGETRQIMSHIPIIHLHGNLGDLPWQGKNNSRPFSFEHKPEELLIAADCIKIIHEDIADGRDKDFERAKQLMSAASQIIFMGFGFNKTNTDRLDVSNLPLGRTVLATTIGTVEQDRRLVAKNCGGKVTLLPTDEDCVHVIRQRLNWT
jgi:hypothetical protein